MLHPKLDNIVNIFNNLQKFFLILLFTILQFSICDANNKPPIKIYCSNFWGSFNNDKKGLCIIFDVIEKYFSIIFTKQDEADIVIDSIFGYQKISNRKAIKIFLTGEATQPKLKGYDLSLGFDYINSEKYLRMPNYYYFSLLLVDGSIPVLSSKYKRVKNNFNNKKFAGILVSNDAEGYSSYGDRQNYKDGVVARKIFFDILSKYKRVDSGGRAFNNIGQIVGSNDTIKWLGNYKFVIAFENASYPGYITEKVFQAYYAGAIPIYYGDKEGLKDINKKAIIYAGDFKSLEELAEFVKKVDNDDALYEKIWSEPLLIDETKSYKSMFKKLEEKFLKILLKKGINYSPL